MRVVNRTTNGCCKLPKYRAPADNILDVLGPRVLKGGPQGSDGHMAAVLVPLDVIPLMQGTSYNTITYAET